MKIEPIVKRKIIKDVGISLFIYSLPVIAIYLYLKFNNLTPSTIETMLSEGVTHLQPFFKGFSTYGYYLLIVLLGIIEFGVGLYDQKWTKHERVVDVISFIAPKLILTPLIGLFGLHFLPFIIPNLQGSLQWVPFWGGIFLIAIADDLTQYWYHRLHHQIPFLWLFHRTHHSAPYMGMSMASRQNFIYTVLFSQIYLTATLVYLGLGLPALFVTALKSLITLTAHSSIAWDKPFYKYKILHPIAWVLERTISTPATHHAHHADTTGDGVGHYKGNFGNMFFIWDIIFGTGIISRQYPKTYGIKNYKAEEWQAQLLWPIFKSKKQGSSLS